MVDHVKIYVKLEKDQDGYPPFDRESLWAWKQMDGTFEIDSIPFYAKSLCLADLITVHSIGDILECKSVVKASNNSTIRVVLYSDVVQDALTSNLSRIGCQYEWDADRSLVAINISSKEIHEEVMKIILPLTNQKLIDYEEATLRF